MTQMTIASTTTSAISPAKSPSVVRRPPAMAGPVPVVIGEREAGVTGLTEWSPTTPMGG